MNLSANSKLEKVVTSRAVFVQASVDVNCAGVINTLKIDVQLFGANCRFLNGFSSEINISCLR